MSPPSGEILAQHGLIAVTAGAHQVQIQTLQGCTLWGLIGDAARLLLLDTPSALGCGNTKRQTNSLLCQRKGRRAPRQGLSWHSQPVTDPHTLDLHSRK